MSRPLALPAGSVRALLLLGLAARTLLDLRADGALAPWLSAVLIVSAAAYFAARAASPRHVVAPAADPLPGAPAPRAARAPLGLPRGTVRAVFLAAVAYGAWLWLSNHRVEERDAPVLVVLGAFLLGVVSRWVLLRLKGGDDEGTHAFEHGQAFIALLCAGGLVTLAVGVRPHDLASWVEPSLAAVCAYYAGAR